MIKPKKWRYKPSQKVRKHISYWEGSDFAKQNKQFGGDAISAKATEFSNMLGDRGKYFTQNELDGMFSTFYNLSPNTFNTQFMSLINNYVNDTSPQNLEALQDTMRNRWVLSKKTHQKGIRNRANADVDLMGGTQGYMLPDSKRMIFPLQKWKDAEQPEFKPQPVIKQPSYTYPQIASVDNTTINTPKNQQNIWDIFDRGAIAYGSQPKQILPSIGDMITDGKNRYFAEMLGLNSIYDTGNLNYEFRPFMIA